MLMLISLTAHYRLHAGRLERDDACRHNGSDRGGSPQRVLVAGIALAIVGPETRVRDSGKGSRHRWDKWSGGSNFDACRTRALDPSVGKQGLALLHDAFRILPM